MPVTTVTTTAAAITTSRTASGGPGSTYRAIATTCSRVFSLPPRLAAITPRRMTQKHSSVTEISRARITAVTHPASPPKADRVSSAAPVSALSAIGSALLPKSVIRPRLRASRPSSRSVTDATPNTANAATRQPVPPASRQATKTGTSTRRSTVSALAALTSPGPGSAGRPGRAGRAAPWGGSPPGSTGPPGQRVWPGGPGVRRQVDPLGPGDPGTDHVADRQRHGRGHGRHPVHLGCLMGRPALVKLAAEILLDQDLHRLADPVGGALGHDFLGDIGQLVGAAGDLRRVQVPGQRGGLGPLLIGVAEDADRVQPGQRQEPLELGQVASRLAGEPHDEVGPDARVRARVPDLVDQGTEPLGVAEPAHRP